MSAAASSSRRSMAFVCLSLFILTFTIFLLSHPDSPSTLCETLNRDYLVGIGQTGGTRAERLKVYKSHFPPVRPSTDRGYPNVTKDDGGVHQMPFDWPGVKTLFAFGDSFTTNYRDIREKGLENGRPETFWHLDRRLRDRTWTDWLWAMFKNTRTTQYYNIARAGATIDWEILPPGQIEWGTLQDQLDDFQDFFTPMPGPESVNWHSNSSLFLMFFGINDISQLDRKTEFELPIRQTVFDFTHSLFEQSSRLYDMGARNFVFLNAHPFYRSPKYTLTSGVGHDIYNRVVNSVTWFNQAFAFEIAKFRMRHRQANVIEFDLFRFIDLVLDEPELFGLTDTERFNMVVDDSGDETNLGHLGFAFRDMQHLSWSVHLLIARALNGLLMRKSTSFTWSNATEDALYVVPPPVKELP